MRKNLYTAMMIAGVTLAVTACGLGQTGGTETAAPAQTESAVETSKTESIADSKEETTKPETTEKAKETEKSSSLEQMAAMIGLSDEEAKTLLGGGTENWSPDHTILIGRIYNTELFGKTAVINTMYDEQNHISMVQAELPDMNASESKKQISEATGVSMEQVEKGEGGQESGQWLWDGLMINLYQNGEASIIELFVPIQ